MTEQEALSRWCPMVRTGAYGDYSNAIVIAINRDPRRDVQEGCNCIASGCMAWRKIPRRDDINEGYCGLAGPNG